MAAWRRRNRRRRPRRVVDGLERRGLPRIVPVRATRAYSVADGLDGRGRMRDGECRQGRRAYFGRFFAVADRLGCCLLGGVFAATLAARGTLIRPRVSARTPSVCAIITHKPWRNSHHARHGPEVDTRRAKACDVYIVTSSELAGMSRPSAWGRFIIIIRHGTGVPVRNIRHGAWLALLAPGRASWCFSISDISTGWWRRPRHRFQSAQQQLPAS